MASPDSTYAERWVVQRDAEAFRALVDQYAGMVFGACRRVLRDASEAEDVAQECFETLAVHPKVPTDYLGPWLHRVAVQRSIDRLRSSTARRKREHAYAQARPTTSDPTWDDLYAYIDEAIAALPEAQRVPVVGHFLEGRTHGELADELGVSRQTVTHRIGQGIERVREQLRKQGITVGAATLTTMLAANTAEAAPTGLLAAAGKLAVAGLAPAAASGVPIALMTGAAIAVATGIVVAAGWLLYRAPELAPRNDVAVELATASLVDETNAPQSSATAKNAPPAEPAQNGMTWPLLDPMAIVKGELITGRVVDETNQPIDEAVITAGLTSPDNYSYHGSFGHNGTFKLRGFRPGDSFEIQAIRRATETEPALASAWAGPFLMRRGGVHDLSITLSPTGSVSGRVVDLDGQPVPNVHLDLNMGVGSRTRDMPMTTESAEDGTFQISNVPPGIYQLRLSTTQRNGLRLYHLSPPWASIDVGISEDIRDIPAVLDGAESISGTILNGKGEPARGYDIRIKSPNTLIGMSTRGRDGSYEMRGLNSGVRYTIGVWPADERRPGTPPITEKQNVMAGSTNVNFVVD